MTLIVAEVTPNDAFVISDTLVTSNWNPPDSPPGPVNGDFHALKVHILDPKICVAVAGAFDVGLRAIAAFKQSGLDLQQEVPSNLAVGLQKSYIGICNNNTMCDFLLLVLRHNSNDLFKITGAGIESIKRAYIGDAEGYRRLQAIRKTYVRPSHQEIQQPDGTFVVEPFTPFELDASFAEQSDAMDALVASRNVPSVGAVGDNIVRIRIARISGGFEYLQQVIAGTNPEEGPFGACLLAQNYEPYAVGIYYLRGGFGLLMRPGYENAYCEKIYSQNLTSFISHIKQQYGLSLDGGVWNEQIDLFCLTPRPG